TSSYGDWSSDVCSSDLGDQPALVLHRGGERERLPAGAGAGVDDDVPGPRVACLGDELASFVLHLEEALLERREREDVGAAREGEAVLRMASGLDARAFRGERGGERLAGRLQCVGADGERGPLVERCR